MADPEQAVEQKKKTLFGSVIKGLDYVIRGLSLVATVPVAFAGFVISVMAAGLNNPIMAIGVLASGLMLAMVLATAAIAPERLTQRLPVSADMRVLLSRLPVFIVMLGMYLFSRAG